MLGLLDVLVSRSGWMVEIATGNNPAHCIIYVKKKNTSIKSLLLLV